MGERRPVVLTNVLVVMLGAACVVGVALSSPVMTVAGGSGFLAIYLAGIMLGNSQLQAMQNILRVNHGMAWLSQIMMFVMLGLLVTPSQIPPIALPAPGRLSTTTVCPSASPNPSASKCRARLHWRYRPSFSP